jgi:probable addiction module antidote protein
LHENTCLKERQSNVIGKKPKHSVAIFYKRHRDNPSAIAEYLNSAFSTGDSAAIAKAIGNMLRAQGVARFAKKAGMRRDTLYRTFNGKTSPPLDRVMDVLFALNIKLSAKPDV